MKNLLLVSLMCFIVVSIGFPQSATKIWEKKLEGDPASQPRGVVCDTSKNIYLEDNYVGSSGNYPRIRKFSPDGTKLWEWVDFSSSGGGIYRKSIVYSTRDNSVIFAANGWIVKLSAGGELLWKTYTQGGVVSVYGDTIVTLQGELNGTISFLEKNGNFVRNFQTGMITSGSLGITLRDNFIWVSAHNPDGIISNTAAYIAKFKTDGTLLWRWNAPDANLAHSDVDKDGNAYFTCTQYRLVPAPANWAGYFRLVAFDPVGNVLWDREWVEHPQGFANYENWTLDVAVSNHDSLDRQVVLLGTTERSDSLHEGNGQFYARCFKTMNGDSLWKLRGDYETAYAVSQYEVGAFTPDGDLVIAGDGFPPSVAVTSYIQKFHSTTTEVRELPMGIPKTFSLSQNYPNPFNPTTRIRFEIPRTMHVKLAIYDLLGREIEALWDGEKSPGTYEADWDASRFPSGIYFARFITPFEVETRKMILLR